MQSYLPSRQFITRIIILIVLIVLAFGVYKISIFLKEKSKNKTATDLIIKPDTIQKDTNKNGIPDWEESLWGLDPKGDGVANKEFIMAKQQELAKNNNEVGTITTGTSTENELLAKQFFAAIMSLQESGDLNDASLQIVVDTVGSKINTKPIADIYTSAMFKKTPSTQASILAYFNAINELLAKYKNKNIGDELTFLATAIKNNDPKAIKATADVGLSYKAFGKELVGIPVPDVALPLIVSMANNYEKTGQSIEGLTKTLTDPIIGMQSLVNYKKYNDALAQDLETLSLDTSLDSNI